MEFSSKKYLILLIIICAVFTIFIIKAYDYLPDKSVENNNPMVNTQVQNQNNNQVDVNVESDQTENYDPERHKSGHIDYMHTETSSYNNYNKNDYEEIKAPKGAYEEVVQTSDNNSYIPTTEELAIKTLLNAQKLKLSSDYNNALAELQKIPDYTNDKEILATSYEKIAELYALQKRYGTALSFAGKAYSTSPSAYRELLIARIYYQSGETDTAISRLNSLLSRGFRD